ncbi:hypothetical protein HZS_5289, partial [Henneguya salminicola]
MKFRLKLNLIQARNSINKSTTKLFELYRTKNHKFVGSLFVVSCGASLVGRDWISMLDLMPNFICRSIVKTESKHFLEDFNDLFSESLR